MHTILEEELAPILPCTNPTSCLQAPNITDNVKKCPTNPPPPPPLPQLSNDINCMCSDYFKIVIHVHDIHYIHIHTLDSFFTIS